jgi:hypothetical protein
MTPLQLLARRLRLTVVALLTAAVLTGLSCPRATAENGTPAEAKPAPDAPGRPAEPTTPPEGNASETKDDPSRMPERYRLDKEYVRNLVVHDEPIALLEGEYNPFEASAYETVVLKARETPVDLLWKFSSRKVTYPHLFLKDTRSEYCGDLVHLEGSLRLLREIPSTERLREQGVPVLYEGWVHPDDRSSAGHLVCVLFSELPKGLTPSESMEVPVKFDGYFFKVFKYKGRDLDDPAKPNRSMRLAPVLIGRTISADLAPRTAVREQFQYTFVPMLIAAVGGLLGVAALLSWVFRRGDRAHRDRVAVYQSNPNPFDRPAPDAEPGPAG